MKNEATERIRERILALIESEFESDAAFERTVCGIFARFDRVKNL